MPNADARARTGDGILLAQVDDGCWLVYGERHLDGLLAGGDAHPRPVRRLRFASTFDLSLFLPEGVALASLWRIHPAIVERLDRHGDLETIEADHADGLRRKGAQ